MATSPSLVVGSGLFLLVVRLETLMEIYPSPGFVFPSSWVLRDAMLALCGVPTVGLPLELKHLP